jgi:parallel beta helix pectate lyase-like protein
MKTMSTALKALTCAFFIMTLSTIVQAQATRTWVSGVGDDLNPCSRTAPCKTYSGALSKTARDGEISTLDPGGFGAVTITKSITINGGGAGQGYGSILASLTSGVTINITDAADIRKTVRLDWLNINGAPSNSPGLTGIRVLAASVVHIENCLIDSFRSTSAGFGHGIHVNIAGAGTTEVVIKNTTSRNNLNAGLRMDSVAATVNVSVDNCLFADNGDGVNVDEGTLNISRSVLSGNSSNGIVAGGAVGSVANVSNCTVVQNNNGINALTAQATVRISGNEIYRNIATGILNTAGTMETLRNNRSRGNGTNQSGAISDVSAIGTGTF